MAAAHRCGDLLLSDMVLIEANPEKPVYVTARNLRIRLAENAEEIGAAQALRYRVFYQEMSAKPSADMAAARRDFDAFDDYCDHLLVLDLSKGDSAKAVVGTYRVMRRAAAAECGQFYTPGEYDIGTLLSYPGEILELGRSCVDAAYRNGTTMQLLWRGIAEYVSFHAIDIMFGCASLPGTDLSRLRLPLAYLHQHHLAPPALRPRARAERFVAMDNLPVEDIDVAAARRSLPPLIKGYLRLGGFVGDGAVVDDQFGTTDVCIVVKTDWVTEKYYRHFMREDPPKDERKNSDVAANDEVR